MLLTLSYDGTAYGGWQRQRNAMTVQQKVEEALWGATGGQITITGASRTDAGVHALGQRAHFDTASRIPPAKYPFALNTLLPADIRVTAGQAVDRAFHARFDAKSKTYTYRILNAPHASAQYRNLCAHVPLPLDAKAMRDCLTTLPGSHDFAAFQAAGGTAKTTVRTLGEASLQQDGSLITLRISGNGFLYNMARIIAGTLIDVGHGKFTGNPFEEAFNTGNRQSLGTTAPACGLELTEIRY
ncbi:MAG: tRNA pseudouridine(38-40) synthase TruA [Clostridia bacterium]|nr:tRNA pseudouridine(38-40) synthase TruA [Clostridia bacterium]